ncbi:IS6 family transposase [Thiotrichales bacterium 19X7-9]|nr:IS6 family transposase [Thiotrichales bacterium 19X7-9]
MISFKWRHFNKMIIMLAIRWYLSYSLSYRDVEELLSERGFKVDHTTVYRWVVNYADQLEASFRQKHTKSKAYRSWRIDETYIRIKGKDYYLYRAVDKSGDTLEFMLSEKRDEASAFKFLKKTIGQHGLPECITIDKSGANEAAIIFLNCMLYLIGLWPYYWVEDRQIKYLNNQIEQDHRAIKRRTRPMLGFKSFKSAESTLAGYELINMLRKGQHLDCANQTIFEQFNSLAG